MRTTVSLAILLLTASCHRSTPPSESNGAHSGTGAAPTTPSTGGDTGATQPAVSGPHVVLRPPGHEPVTVRVEVARTPGQRQRGLMYRRDLDEMAGMIFLFPEAEHQAFWMHDTYLPLDMMFISPERVVQGVVQNATPMTDDTRELPADAGVSQYVLEVRAGFAARHHIAAGTTVEFVNIPPATE